MTGHELMAKYCALTGIDPATPYSVWAFGGAPDELSDLVKNGIKTATASAYELYDADTPLPQVGDISVIVDSRDEAVCIVRTETLSLVLFSEVTAAHAYMEGEGDRSLAYWRQVHAEFFADEYARYGLTFREDIPVLCETFSLLYAVGARDVVTESARLCLRRHTWDDFDHMKAVLCDPVNMKYYRQSFDDTTVRRWMRWHLSNYRNLGFGLWALEDKETGRYIGDCGITMQRIHGQFLPEIGYHIRLDCHRQGYASEAARVCRDWVFTHTPFQAVYSYMDSENEGSWRVALANGMRQVDEYDEDGEHLLVFAITKSEWEALLCNGKGAV